LVSPILLAPFTSGDALVGVGRDNQLLGVPSCVLTMRMNQEYPILASLLLFFSFSLFLKEMINDQERLEIPPGSPLR
jgi:hypothetical protein